MSEPLGPCMCGGCPRCLRLQGFADESGDCSFCGEACNSTEECERIQRINKRTDDAIHQNQPRPILCAKCGQVCGDPSECERIQEAKRAMRQEAIEHRPTPPFIKGADEYWDFACDLALVSKESR